MRINRITGTLLTVFAAVSLYQASAQNVTLSGTSYTNTFDTFETDGGPPTGWVTYTGANATSPGSIFGWTNGCIYASYNTWRTTSGRFANQASSYSYGSAYSGATNFVGTESPQIQTNEPNRCIAVRQTGSLGDPGAAFVFKIADTLNRKNFHLYMDLLSLDSSVGRSNLWTIDYGFGNPPSSFVPVASWRSWASNFITFHTNITLPNGTVDNNAGPVWIRVVTLTASLGAGNRPTTGIDNFGLTWEEGVACTPVSINANPASITNGYVNGTATFTCGALGTAPRYYQWIKNGTITLTDDARYTGSTSPNLQITALETGDAGTYSCVVSNVCDTTLNVATSTGATLAVATPPVVSIGYLRSLVDPSTFATTNQNLLYTTTGMITTYTNTTTGNTASYYIQDGTGGVNLFCTFASTFRPNIGDVVKAVGFLSTFGGAMELVCDLSVPAQSVTVLSNNIAGYPAPKLLAWDNLYQFATNASLNYNTVGSVVLLTNVYFTSNTITYGATSNGTNYNLFVTNSAGKAARVFIPASQDLDMTNRTLSGFAYAVHGVLIASSTSQYEVMPTAWSEVVTTGPTVALDTPINGASFTAPANIPLAATVTENGYPVSAVRFFNGASQVGSDPTAPYSYAWNGVGVGSYPLSAVADYTLYGVNVIASSGVNTASVVQPLAPVSSMEVGAGPAGTLNISYAGGSAAQFVLLGTNVITAPVSTWPVIQTTNGTTPAVFNVPVGSGEMYYKIKSQ
jgi:hypothetical protein